MTIIDSTNKKKNNYLKISFPPAINNSVHNFKFKKNRHHL